MLCMTGDAAIVWLCGIQAGGAWADKKIGKMHDFVLAQAEPALPTLIPRKMFTLVNTARAQRSSKPRFSPQNGLENWGESAGHENLGESGKKTGARC